MAVSAPDGSYEVAIGEVWVATGIDDEAGWTLPDATIEHRIREAMLEVESVAGPNADPQDKKTVVISLAAQFTLEQEGDQMMSSMEALDVSIDFDADAQRQQLESRSEKLLDAIRPDGVFHFRSH